MATLDTQQLQQLRNALEERQEQLLRELDEIQSAHLERATQAGSTEHDSFATQATRTAQHEVRDAEARRDHDELVAVRTALQRLADGSYGDCISCGEDIGLARLQAFPPALRCLPCQNKQETR